MSQLARKFIIGLLIPVALVLAACGTITSANDETERLKARLTDELTVKRGFTNVDFEKVETRYEDSARALVSVSNCRIRLEWEESKSWRLGEDSKIDDLKGELTATQIATSEPYKDCAQQPTPSTLPKPNS